MDWLNYNHLFYFWVIADEMSVTRAAQRLGLSQSNLSGRLKELEESLGEKLFERSQRALQLTEAGRVAKEYADVIFTSGQEMMDLFRNRPLQPGSTQFLRIGAISSLSKNLQMQFLAPLFQLQRVRVTVTQGQIDDLLEKLRIHHLDLIISNTPGRTDLHPDLHNHPLAEVPVYLVGKPGLGRPEDTFKELLTSWPVFLPTRQSNLRAEFDTWAERNGIRLRIQAEIEDMALLRLCALHGEGIALVPEIVVKDELENRLLVRLGRIPSLYENFYVISASRRFLNMMAMNLLDAARRNVFAPEPKRPRQNDPGVRME